MQRKDDTPEVVANRLKTYHEQTAAGDGLLQEERQRYCDDRCRHKTDEVTAAVFKPSLTAVSDRSE